MLWSRGEVGRRGEGGSTHGEALMVKIYFMTYIVGADFLSRFS